MGYDNASTEACAADAGRVEFMMLRPRAVKRFLFRRYPTRRIKVTTKTATREVKATLWFGCHCQVGQERTKERTGVKKEKRRDLVRMKWRLGHKAPTKGRSKLQAQVQKRAKISTLKPVQKRFATGAKPRRDKGKPRFFFSCVQFRLRAGDTELEKKRARRKKAI